MSPDNFANSLLYDFPTGERNYRDPKSVLVISNPQNVFFFVFCPPKMKKIARFESSLSLHTLLMTFFSKWFCFYTTKQRHFFLWPQLLALWGPFKSSEKRERETWAK